MTFTESLQELGLPDHVISQILDLVESRVIGGDEVYSLGRELRAGTYTPGDDSYHEGRNDLRHHQRKELRREK